MKKQTDQNAVTQRLDLLKIHYGSFWAQTDAKICLWLIEVDECQMIDNLVESETSVTASTPNLLLEFDTPFKNRAQYENDLLEAHEKQFREYLEQPEEHRENVQWKPVYKSGRDVTGMFFENMSRFGQAIPGFEDNVIVFLTPTEVADFKALESWLMDCMDNGLADNVRIMLLDYLEDRHFTRLEADAGRVKTITPALNMPQAMKEIAAAAGGGNNNPGVKFQQVFIDLSTACGKGDVNAAEKLANQALQIAVAENWPHLQVAVHLALGSAWMRVKNPENAVKSYENGLQCAKAAISAGEDIGQKLAVNALFSKGAVLIGEGDFRSAAETYRAAIPFAEKCGDPFMLMEAWRMEAYALENTKSYAEAMRSYEMAAETAGQLDEAVRLNSTVAYVGQGLLRQNDRLTGGDKKTNADIHARMKALLGEKWQPDSPN